MKYYNLSLFVAVFATIGILQASDATLTAIPEEPSYAVTSEVCWQDPENEQLREQACKIAEEHRAKKEKKDIIIDENEEKAPIFPFDLENTGKLVFFTVAFILWNEGINDWVKGQNNSTKIAPADTPAKNENSATAVTAAATTASTQPTFIAQHANSLSELTKMVGAVLIADPLKEQMKLIKTWTYARILKPCWRLLKNSFSL